MVSLSEVFLSRVLLWQIEARAEATYPEECCGLLVGSRNASSITINRAETSPNMSGETQGVDARRSF